MLTVKFVAQDTGKGKRQEYLVTVNDFEKQVANFTVSHNAKTGWKSLIGAAARQLRKQIEGVEGAVAEKPTSQLETF